MQTDSLSVFRIRVKGPIAFYQSRSLICSDFDSEFVEQATERMSWDEPVVDCSYQIFNCVNILMFHPEIAALYVFPLQRWRSHRNAEGFNPTDEEIRNADRSFLYTGSPAGCFRSEEGSITVPRSSDFLIKSGPQLGF